MTSSPATMRAIRLSGPGPVDNLRLTTPPLPPEREGWVRIRVEAFGVNRSELKLRLGLSEGVYDGLEQVRHAHHDMEQNRATGKLVVRVRH